MIIHSQRLGKGGNKTDFPNKNIVPASKHEMAISKNMTADDLTILINDAVQEPWYYPEQQVNVISFLYNFSVNANDDNTLLTLFYPDYLPYEDNIPGWEVFLWERSRRQKWW